MKEKGHICIFGYNSELNEEHLFIGGDLHFDNIGSTNTSNCSDVKVFKFKPEEYDLIEIHLSFGPNEWTYNKMIIDGGN